MSDKTDQKASDEIEDTWDALVEITPYIKEQKEKDTNQFEIMKLVYRQGYLMGYQTAARVVGAIK